MTKRIVNKNSRFKYTAFPMKKPYWSPREEFLLKDDHFYYAAIAKSDEGLEFRNAFLGSRSIKSIQCKKFRLRTGYSRKKPFYTKLLIKKLPSKKYEI